MCVGVTRHVNIYGCESIEPGFRCTYIYIYRLTCRFMLELYFFVAVLKQTACRCPTVGAAAPAALGGRRAGA